MLSFEKHMSKNHKLEFIGLGGLTTVSVGLAAIGFRALEPTYRCRNRARTDCALVHGGVGHARWHSLAKHPAAGRVCDPYRARRNAGRPHGHNKPVPAPPGEQSQR